MPTNDERIAVLEADAQDTKAKLDEVLGLQRTMSEQLSRYKGFVGGMVFIVSALWVFLVFVKDIALAYFK